MNIGHILHWFSKWSKIVDNKKKFRKADVRLVFALSLDANQTIG